MKRKRNLVLGGYTRLTESAKNDFQRRLYVWYLKHEIFLSELSEKANEKGYFPYKHRNVRSDYASLKWYMRYLFSFKKECGFNIERTTNRFEGLFKHLKRSLNNHNILTKKSNPMFIKDFLNKKSC